MSISCRGKVKTQIFLSIFHCNLSTCFSSHHEDVKNFQPAEIKIEVCEQFFNEEEVHERKEFYDNFDEKKVKIEPTCCTESWTDLPK